MLILINKTSVYYIVNKDKVIIFWRIILVQVYMLIGKEKLSVFWVCESNVSWEKVAL